MSKKLTTQEFIDKAILKHGYTYDYSLVDYKGNKKNVTIICKEHGKFEQSPYVHIITGGCRKCGYVLNSKNFKYNNNKFISKANKKHGDTYDYSLVNYINSTTNVIIICKEHGEFPQRPANHLSGQGCPECAGNIFKKREEFIIEANIIHNNLYDYSLVNYKGSNIPIEIICKKHGVFLQTPHNHLNGRTCGKCYGYNKTTEEFIIEANIIHNNLYDYSLLEYVDCSIPIKIICKKHGIFLQRPSNHLIGQGCPKCRSSKGETETERILIKYNIAYEKQKKFDYCKYTRSLPFDFYLTDKNILIEYDGEQHFNSKSHHNTHKNNRTSLELTQLKDKIKTDYCINNNIKLIRITYTEFNNIEKILIKELDIII